MINTCGGIKEVKDVQDWIAEKRLFKRGVKIKQITKQFKNVKKYCKKTCSNRKVSQNIREMYVLQ
jgi:hypothetical protein